MATTTAKQAETAGHLADTHLNKDALILLALLDIAEQYADALLMEHLSGCRCSACRAGEFSPFLLMGVRQARKKAGKARANLEAVTCGDALPMDGTTWADDLRRIIKAINKAQTAG